MKIKCQCAKVPSFALSRLYYIFLQYYLEKIYIISWDLFNIFFVILHSHISAFPGGQQHFGEKEVIENLQT